MTALREEIGQLFMLGFSGRSVTPEVASLLAEYRPGGVILFSRNLEYAEQIASLTNDLQRHAPHGPLLIGIDQEGGRVSRLPASEFTIFPPCALIGHCGSAALAYAVAQATATELRAVGINMNMAPVLDVQSNEANPVIGDRAFGAHPAQVSELGLATLRGLQEQRVVACGKHFPGHGDTDLDSHLALPVVRASREVLMAREVPPFAHAIHGGLAAIMTAHVQYPALDDRWPATLSHVMLTDLLRRDLRFDGLVLTDDLEMRAIVDHYGVGEAAVRSFLAGADVLLICKEPDRQAEAMDAVRRAVDEGTITGERLARSLRRVEQVKRSFLLPYQPVEPSTAKALVGVPAHRALRERLLQSMPA
jgi:beta-N-acetylhexosaminidase